MQLRSIEMKSAWGKLQAYGVCNRLVKSSHRFLCLQNERDNKWNEALDVCWIVSDHSFGNSSCSMGIWTCVHNWLVKLVVLSPMIFTYYPIVNHQLQFFIEENEIFSFKIFESRYFLVWILEQKRKSPRQEDRKTDVFYNIFCFLCVAWDVPSDWCVLMVKYVNLTFALHTNLIHLMLFWGHNPQNCFTALVCFCVRWTNSL